MFDELVLLFDDFIQTISHGVGATRERERRTFIQFAATFARLICYNTRAPCSPSKVKCQTNKCPWVEGGRQAQCTCNLFCSRPSRFRVCQLKCTHPTGAAWVVHACMQTQRNSHMYGAFLSLGSKQTAAISCAVFRGAPFAPQCRIYGHHIRLARGTRTRAIHPQSTRRGGTIMMVCGFAKRNVNCVRFAGPRESVYCNVDRFALAPIICLVVSAEFQGLFFFWNWSYFA